MPNFTNRFIKVISFYVILTLLPLIAYKTGTLTNQTKVGDMYSLLSVFVGILWYLVGEGYVNTGKLNLSI